MAKSERKSIYNAIVYLDPLDCGSTIGYTINRRRTGSISAQVDLTDCNRKIEWYFSDSTPIQKIDTAIAILTEFRTKLLSVTKKKTRRR